MHTRALVMALAAILLGAGVARAQTGIWEGHAYEVSVDQMTWFEAAVWAEERGGYLVSLNTPAEEVFVRSLVPMNWMGGEERYHIGLTDEVEEGVWRWLDGTAPSYFNWHAMEPNNYNNEDYVQANVQGPYWNDHNGFEVNYAVAEIPTEVVPEPATLLLLGTGLVGVAGLAWRRERGEA